MWPRTLTAQAQRHTFVSAIAIPWLKVDCRTPTSCVPYGQRIHGHTFANKLQRYVPVWQVEA